MSKPVDFMILESSVYSWSNKCLNKCLEFKDNFFLSDVLKLNDIEKENFLNYYKNCLSSCSINFIVTRDKTKELFFKDLDDVEKKNSDIYTNFYR